MKASGCPDRPSACVLAVLMMYRGGGGIRAGAGGHHGLGAEICASVLWEARNTCRPPGEGRTCAMVSDSDANSPAERGRVCHLLYCSMGPAKPRHLAREG